MSAYRSDLVISPASKKASRHGARAGKRMKRAISAQRGRTAVAV
jgi:hypothetical protein